MESTLSVVVTSYNRPNKLRRMIDSAFNQTINPDEIIVINDGSTIDYSDLKKWALSHPQIVWKDIENGGVSNARNYGVLIASSSFVAFCDDDDYFLPNHIEYLKNRISAEKNAKGLYHTHRVELKNSEISKPTMKRRREDMTWQEHYITDGEMIPSCTCMHRDVAIKFTFPEKIKYAEDHEQRLLAMSEYPCFPIYETTVVMDRSDESATNRSVSEIAETYRNRFRTMFNHPLISGQIRRVYKHRMLYHWTSLELSETMRNNPQKFLALWIQAGFRIKSWYNFKTWIMNLIWFTRRISCFRNSK